jgi:hypothetical protein
MGNSTVKLQGVIDYVQTIGDLQPVIPAGGFSRLLACEIASDVMTEMLAERFNWKWNRIVCPPFLTISWQQDYARSVKNLGWLEHACVVDINNTALPKPLIWIECVRDLERTSYQLGQPAKICWLPNDQLIEATWATWPGPNQVYTNPLNAPTTPANGPTNIIDAHGNILVLTTYGTTGSSAPDAGATPVIDATVTDGSCVWTVLDPKAQGFRISPLPPQTGRVWEVHVVAQARPVVFSALSQTLDPIPDDYKKHFQDGFIAYMHRHSSAPMVRNRFEEMKRNWLMALATARGQGDRERDDAAIVPDKNVMAGGEALPLGPAWPYGPYGNR